MPQVTYELVEPLVGETQSTGASLSVVFVCPVSGQQIRAQGKPSGDVGAGGQVKKSIMRNMRWSMMGAVRRMFGYSIVGQIGGGIANAAMMGGGGGGVQLNKAQTKEALVDAFVNVSGQFAWDATNDRFVSAQVFKELQTEFQVALQAAQITKDWDRHTLARILTEIAAADGSVDESERGFFHSFTGGTGPTLDELLAKPSLTKAELDEVSPELKPVMLMLAMGVAMGDETFDQSEHEKLSFFAQSFGISADQYKNFLRMAQEFIVDQAIEHAYADGTVDAAERAQVNTLAQKLGVDQDRVDRLDVRCRKRKGIM
ncbi:MAG: uncharacterized membrane protein YebE (DUF533 family) [Myxococcota bacterium]|jgi:uncharacterized membrane protein YebE (DUF533 family)